MGCGANDIISCRAAERGRRCMMCHDVALKRHHFTSWPLQHVPVLNQRLHCYFPEMQEQVSGQSGRNKQVSQIRRLSRTIERGTNDELKGLVATLVLGL